MKDGYIPLGIGIVALAVGVAITLSANRLVEGVIFLLLGAGGVLRGAILLRRARAHGVVSTQLRAHDQRAGLMYLLVGMAFLVICIGLAVAAAIYAAYPRNVIGAALALLGAFYAVRNILGLRKTSPSGVDASRRKG